VYRAAQRARWSNGATTWVEELYGRRPAVITAVIARVTYELMIEQQRQEEIAAKSGPGKVFDPDVALRMYRPEVWRWMRKIEVRL